MREKKIFNYFSTFLNIIFVTLKIALFGTMLELLGRHWSHILVFLLGFFFAMWIFRSRRDHAPVWPKVEDVNRAINRPVLMVPPPEEIRKAVYEQPLVLPAEPIEEDVPEEEYLPMDLGSYTLNPVKRTKRSVGEIECCRVMENLTGKSFITVRPSFLVNPETGKNMELDCYNDELKIAIEYNGVQHYNYTGAFGQTKEAFLAQARRDLLKVDLCDKYGIYLITVPYHIQKEDIEKYIVERLPF